MICLTIQRDCKKDLISFLGEDPGQDCTPADEQAHAATHLIEKFGTFNIHNAAKEDCILNDSTARKTVVLRGAPPATSSQTKSTFKRLLPEKLEKV